MKEILTRASASVLPKKDVPKLHVTVTHYDAGKSNVRTYLFRDYTPELAQAHGVRAAYPSFGYDYIRQTAQTYINSEFLELA